jgi:thiol-disulfide isomerase/thioredoxin
MRLIKWYRFGWIAAAASIAFALQVAAQAPQPAPRTFYYDFAGNAITNNEFVDIRMANYNYPDATIVKKLEDGTTEFRLQKVPQEGMASPEFSVRSIDGTVIGPGELRGKVVVLNFWFIGCHVCRGMKPRLNELRSRFVGNPDVVFLSLTADPVSEVKKYAQKEPLAYLQAADAKPALDKFVFSGYPKNIVISRSGEIVYWRSTVKAWDKFESVIRTELDKR